MKILIANGEMVNFFGGTQTWTITMVKALRKLGHDVDFTGVDPGMHSHFESLYKPLSGSYDLLIANANSALHYKAFQKVFIVHGILSPFSRAITGADKYFAVSEETVSRHFKCAGILRNPIDLDEFPLTPLPFTPTVGFFDRRRDFPYINEVKKFYNILEIGNPPVRNVTDALKECSIVVSLGRGAYEAMAMGRNVIISGANSGRSDFEMMDGLVTNASFFEFRKNNCSGRRVGALPTAEAFMTELNKATSEQGAKNRALIEEHNDSIKIAKQLLSLL